MTDYRKVFIDTAPFIYYIEKNEDNPQYFDKVKHFLINCYENDVSLVTSVITLEEYMVFPYRNNLNGYIEMFEKLILTLSIEMIEVDSVIARKAAKIRAEYKSFKAMDALQLAAACIKGCDLFLTNDKQLRQFKEIRCMTVDELV